MMHTDYNMSQASTMIMLSDNQLLQCIRHCNVRKAVTNELKQISMIVQVRTHCRQQFFWSWPGGELQLSATRRCTLGLKIET